MSSVRFNRRFGRCIPALVVAFATQLLKVAAGGTASPPDAWSVGHAGWL
ncbi:hypothetical protein ACVC7V_22280 [Hydrogenophaga sp. A37]